MTVREHLKAAGYNPEAAWNADWLQHSRAGIMECNSVEIQTFTCRPSQHDGEMLGVRATAIAKNRQKFCPDCTKKRQAEQSHKSYLKHREYYLQRSLAQAERRKQEAIEAKRLEEFLLAKRPEPKYSISQVVKKAKELGISYGNCSLLLRLEKITI